MNDLTRAKRSRPGFSNVFQLVINFLRLFVFCWIFLLGCGLALSPVLEGSSQGANLSQSTATPFCLWPTAPVAGQSHDVFERLYGCALKTTDWRRGEAQFEIWFGSGVANDILHDYEGVDATTVLVFRTAVLVIIYFLICLAFWLALVSHRRYRGPSDREPDVSLRDDNYAINYSWCMTTARHYADTVYYIGFLLTLVSMVVALTSTRGLEPEDIGIETVADAAIAISSTIVALFLRSIWIQFLQFVPRAAPGTKADPAADAGVRVDGALASVENERVGVHVQTRDVEVRVGPMGGPVVTTAADIARTDEGGAAHVREDIERILTMGTEGLGKLNEEVDKLKDGITNLNQRMGHLAKKADVMAAALERSGTAAVRKGKGADE